MELDNGRRVIVKWDKKHVETEGASKLKRVFGGKGLACDHIYMFLSIPPKLSLSDGMQRIEGRSSRQIQMEFPDLRKRYWGKRVRARRYSRPPRAT